MQLKPGTRLRSVTDSTEVVVVRAPAESIDIRCGGVVMVAMDAGVTEMLPVVKGFAEGTQVGKRYGDETMGIELLCTKAGTGSISIGDEILLPKGAKALPSSD